VRRFFREPVTCPLEYFETVGSALCAQLIGARPRDIASYAAHTHTALGAGPRNGERVLLLHGWPEFADCWREILTALGAAGYRAVAVDQRGYGANARPRDIASYAAGHLQSDALAFADQLGAKRFHLIAHDWGGLVAWGLASAHPSRVSSLSVLATPHPQA